MSDCRLELSAPAYLVLVADGREVKIDPYEASRKIGTIATASGADLWPEMRKLLAGYLGVGVEIIAENQAQQFDAAIAAMVGRLDEELKKTSGMIACLPPLIPASSPATESGPSGASEPGLATSDTAA